MNDRAQLITVYCVKSVSLTCTSSEMQLRTARMQISRAAVDLFGSAE